MLRPNYQSMSNFSHKTPPALNATASNLNASINTYQKFTKQKTQDIQIVPVSHETKCALVLWLLDLRVIKNKSGIDLTRQLPQICTDGVIFCDIINQ